MEQQVNQITYLENLPYLVFVEVSAKLKGLDLINFCQSSPLINEKCNRDFVSISGNVVRQYIFAKLLEKMGIPVRENPRDQYVNLIKHRSYFTISKKFDIYCQLWGISNDVKTIYDLLYANPLDFIESPILFNIDLHLRLTENPRSFLREASNLVFDTEILAKRLGQEYDTFHDRDVALGNIYREMKVWYVKLKPKLDGNEKLYSYLDFEILKFHVSPKGFSDINHIFAKILKEAIRDGNYNNTRQDLNQQLITDQHIEFFQEGEDALSEIVKYVMDHRDELRNFTEDELDYLCYLHYKVVNEEIPVLESFEYLKLIGYE